MFNSYFGLKQPRQANTNHLIHYKQRCIYRRIVITAITKIVKLDLSQQAVKALNKLPDNNKRQEYLY